MQTLSTIRTLLEERGLSPRKRFGQNFLIDHNLIRRLVDDAGVGEGDAVLEVGPGTGALTEELLERGCDVTCVEIDRGLAALLRDRFGSRIRLIEGDCLEHKRALHPEITFETDFRLVANLPYACATPLMLVLLQERRCLSMHVTIQKEVADRLLATPSTDAYGSISVVAQVASEVKRVATLPPECFWPRPEVTSAMVSLRARETDVDIAGLASFCQDAFARRRKQLGSVLGRDRAWPEGIDPTCRAEQLDAASIVALYRAFC